MVSYSPGARSTSSHDAIGKLCAGLMGVAYFPLTFRQSEDQGREMDWIERWFGVSPDNGDGSLEMLISLCAIVGALIAIAYLHPRARAHLATLAEEARRLPSKFRRWTG